MNDPRTIAQRQAYKLLSGIIPGGSSDLRQEAIQIADQAILEIENLPASQKSNLGYMLSRMVYRLINEYYTDSYREDRRIVISSAACAANIANVLDIRPAKKEVIVEITRIQRKDINRALWSHNYHASIMGNTITVHAYPGGMIIKGRIRSYAKYCYEYLNSTMDNHAYSQWESQDVTDCEWTNDRDPSMVLQLIQCVMHLSIVHRHILYHIYGLWGCEKYTVDELAVKLGMTSRNIRYHLEEALSRLRKFMSSNDSKGDFMNNEDLEKKKDLINFIKDLTEKHQLEMNALNARISQLEKENKILKKSKTPTDLLIHKGITPFVQFSFQYIEQLMSEMDDDFRQKLVKSLNLNLKENQVQ